MNTALFSSPNRILLIRLKGIGDVILSTPVTRALRKAFPKAEIHFLTRSFCAPILRHNPTVDRVWVLPEKKAPFSETIRLLQEIRAAKFDWAVDLAAEPRSAWLTLATAAPLRAGYAFRVRKWAFNHVVPKNKVRKYQAEVNLDIIRALGVESDGHQTEIFLGRDDEDWADKEFEKPEMSGLKWKIGLNPTGTWSSKRWPIDHWRRLALLIHDRWGVKPIFMGGPGDEDKLQEVRWGIEDKVLEKPPTSLLQAAAYISKLDIVIGNDGTPQHLAQALGTKSLTLCGPHWGIGWTKPSDPRHRFLQYFLDCGPCDKNVCPFSKVEGKDPHIHQECLVKITPAAVFTASGEMLGI